MTQPDQFTDEAELTCPRCVVRFAVTKITSVGEGGDPVQVLAADGKPPRSVAEANAVFNNYDGFNCPNGHRLPRRFLQYPNVVIVLLGLDGTGKGSFLYSMTAQASGRAAPLITLGVRLEMVGFDRAEFNDQFKNMTPPTDKKALPPTRTDDRLNTISMSAVRVRDNVKVNVVVIDVPGELLHNEREFRKFAPAVRTAAAILVFADPRMLDSSGGAGEDLFAKFQSMMEVLEDRVFDERPLELGPPMIGLLLSQADRLADASEFAEWWPQPPTYLEIGDVLHRIGTESERLRAFLDASDSRRGILHSINRPIGPVVVHAVSATGCDKREGDDVYEKYAPVRCLDPLVVLLAWLGFIESGPVETGSIR